MSWGVALPLIAQALQGIGGALMGGETEDEKFAKYRHKRAKEMEGGLLAGLGDADLAKIMAYMRKAAMPFINRAAGGAAARFGSRSGAVAGAMSNAIGQSYAEPLANFAMQIPQINMANKRALLAAYAS
jgi:hypothetical protein